MWLKLNRDPQYSYYGSLFKLGHITESLAQHLLAVRPLNLQAPGVCEAGRAMAFSGYWREMSGLFQFVQDVGLNCDNLMSFALRTTASVTRDDGFWQW